MNLGFGLYLFHGWNIVDNGREMNRQHVYGTGAIVRRLEHLQQPIRLMPHRRKEPTHPFRATVHIIHFHRRDQMWDVESYRVVEVGL
jgi:hypothetical protein